MNNQPSTGNTPIQPNKPQDGAFNSQKKQEAKSSSVNGDKSSNNNGNTNSDVSSGDQWKAKISGAKQQWSKLQQEELVATDGNSDQLSSLVQKRYSMNKADADKQVKEFFGKQH